MDYLKKLWRGELPLIMVCWVFWLGVWVIYQSAYVFLGNQTEQFTTVAGITINAIFMMFGIVYWPFIAIAIWRTADKF